MAFRPISNALPSSLLAGPKPPWRLTRPEASLPIAAEPVPATKTMAGPCGIAERTNSRSVRTSTKPFGNCSCKNRCIWSWFSGRPVPASPAHTAATSNEMQMDLTVESIVSCKAASAAGKPIRVGFEAAPLPRARTAPASFKTTHSVFVPPPSIPRTHFIRPEYARICMPRQRASDWCRKFCLPAPRRIER